MLKSIFQQEPVVVVNAISGVIEASLALALAFGLPVSTAQVGAIMALVVAVGAGIRVLVVRPQVTPVANRRHHGGPPQGAAGADQIGSSRSTAK